MPAQNRRDLQVKVDGLDQLRRQVRQINPDLGRELRATNKSVAEMVVQAALPNVPVRSGRLRRSVKATATQKAAYGKAGTPARVPYAAAIHWGEGAGNVGGGASRRNRNIQGRPFLWDAADRTINRAVAEYEDAIQDLLDRAVRT